MKITFNSNDGSTWTGEATAGTDADGDPCVDLADVVGVDLDGNRAAMSPETLADFVFYAAQKLGLPPRW